MKRIRNPRKPTCKGWNFHIFTMGSLVCRICKGKVR